MIFHPGLGFFVGYRRTWFFQRFKKENLWGQEPRFAPNITFFRTFEDAKEFLTARKFPEATGIVEYEWK